MDKKNINNLFDDELENKPIEQPRIKPINPAFQNNTRVFNINDLISFDKNKDIFEIKDIESKAKSILEVGLLQMPRVKPIENSNKAYILAGHKRVEACRMLVKQGHKEFEHIRCEIDERDLLTAELAMIDTNLEASKLSSFELMQAIGRRAELIEEKRKNSVVSGRTVDIIADNSYLQRTQVGYYLKCYKKLVKSSKDALRENLITFKNAIELADASEEIQNKTILYMRSKNADFKTSFNHASQKINSIDELKDFQKKLIAQAFRFRYKGSISYRTTVNDLKKWLRADVHYTSNSITSDLPGISAVSPKGWRIAPISGENYIDWKIILEVIKEQLKDEIEKEKLFYQHVQDNMMHKLQTKVQIKPDKIEIQYSDQEDFNRILEELNLLDQSLT